MTTEPFRTLRRALVRRRIAQIDTRLRVELLALTAMIAGFVYWQARIPLDSLTRSHGSLAAVGAVLATWTVFAIAAGTLAGARHLSQLGASAPGPAWLSLPLDDRDVLDHLEWEARAHVWWVTPAAPGLLLAAVGLVPWPALPFVAAYFWLALVGAGRLGGAAATAIALRRSAPRAEAGAAARLLARAARASATPRRRKTRWHSGPAWRALWRKDALLQRRPTAARSKLPMPLALAVLSFAAWGALQPPELARFVAFALALITAGMFGEWLIALAGHDPFALLRALPVGVLSIWGARMVTTAMISLALVAGHALAARSLSPLALQLFLIWLGCASFLIMTLAVHYGITLAPRADIAHRLYLLALGTAMAASLMIPLVGWVVLLAGVLHSMRRLPRWAWLEDAR